MGYARPVFTSSAVSVRQTRLADAVDYTRGYDGGVAELGQLYSCTRRPARGSAPIFFSIDEDIDLNTWKSVAVEWLRGINSVLGVGRTGVYGHSRACAWAIGRRHRTLNRGRALVGVADEGVVRW